MKESILVTGGAGFIGSHLVDRLVEEGWIVRVVDNFSSGSIKNLEHHKNNDRVEVLMIDLKDPQRTLEAVKGITTVFHFAANPEVRLSTVSPETHFNENVVATFNLLEAMRKSDVKDLVFASSSSVYGEPASIPVSEEAPLRPVSVYGASKVACESLIHAYSRLYGIKAVVLRYANVVGPRLKHGVIYDFIVKLLKQPNLLTILGDGTQIRSYVHISDAVEATMIAWRRTNTDFEVYNVGSEDWATVNEVAKLIASVMDLKDVQFAYQPTLHGVGWPGDVKKVFLAIDKLKSLGWRPKMNSRQAILEAARSILQEIKSG